LPHKQLSGFWSSDAQIQLRQRGIDTPVLAGMSANLCVESHLLDAVENGFEVLTVSTPSPPPPEVGRLSGDPGADENQPDADDR